MAVAGQDTLAASQTAGLIDQDLTITRPGDGFHGATKTAIAARRAGFRGDPRHLGGGCQGLEAQAFIGIDEQAAAGAAVAQRAQIASDIFHTVHQAFFLAGCRRPAVPTG